MASHADSFAEPPRANDESDLDPAAFLQSVRELSERREREDAERYRKLEEEIEKGRQERAKRRADRARSISPEKPTSARTSTPPAPKTTNTIASPPPLTPQTASSSTTMEAEPSQAPAPASEEVPEFQGFGSKPRPASIASPAQTPATHQSQPSPKPQTATSLARSGTLSWQQRRPTVKVGGPRPQSIARANGDHATAGDQSVKQETESSREQIAASLGSMDPSWFRQTADRGAGNAAFRKSKEETSSEDSMATPSGRRGLPGMSRETSAEPARQTSPAPSDVTFSSSRPGSVRESAVSASRFSTVRSSTSSRPDLSSLIAADEAQEKAAPMSERPSSVMSGESGKLTREPTNTSMSQNRMSTVLDRPSSPTKGMGGFVQSAMMKRSDSVNKRWTAQGSGVSRHNSVASNVSGQGGLGGSRSMPRLEPPSKESSAEPASRPQSRDSNATTTTTTTTTTATARDDQDGFVKPIRPHHTRSKSVASNFSAKAGADERPSTPPGSPPKRFSPTKSTWLESAISKPESPRPTSISRNSQPSWMADIAKAKAQRASVDITPKTLEQEAARSPSPTKPAFGQGMLRRADSRDIDLPLRTGTPTIGTTRSSQPQSVIVAPSQQPQPIASSSASLDKPTISESADTPSGLDEKLETISKPAEPVDEPIAPTKSPALSKTATSKSKPVTPPKPRTDFRSNLRPKPPQETKQAETPEFLSRVGNLRRTQTQNYKAPDVLKNNIMQGKADLAKSSGPVKQPFREEFRDSLQAKKEQWKKEKEEAIVHERKTSAPLTPQKPEALAKRDGLGRSQTIKAASADAEKPKDATPEALARHKSLREKQKPSEPAVMPDLSKQTSAPARSASPQTPSFKQQPSETSKLAARFNPGLAGILARGPPPPSTESNDLSRAVSNDSPAKQRTSTTITSEEPATAGAPLEDMRKGRAKGPKRRKGGAKDTAASSSTVTESATTSLIDTSSVEVSSLVQEEDPKEAPVVVEKPKLRAPPGTAASIMMNSLRSPQTPGPMAVEPESPLATSKNIGSTKPVQSRSTFSQSPALASRFETQPSSINKPAAASPLPSSSQPQTTVTPNPPQDEIAEFRGFGSTSKSTIPSIRPEDNKENSNSEDLPSVKTAASMWGRRQSPTPKSQPSTPSQVQLPSRRDEEAAMRSAGLLASSPSRPSSRDGLEIAIPKFNSDAAGMKSPASASALPPKPAKSSRIVSGQLAEASPNKSSSEDVEHELKSIFGFIPSSTVPLMIDTHAMMSNSPHQERIFKTLRKQVHAILPDGSSRVLPEHENYTFFDSSVQLCTHTYTIANGPKKTEIFLWVGKHCTEGIVDAAQTVAKKQAKGAGNAFVHTIRQGLEPPGFLQALGGILITRRGSRDGASKRYMLCGRKHLGQIVFDESATFAPEALCQGFAYLISHPVTLQETKLYLWKGSACSPDEISAARLAAMDLSETGDVIEVDGGVEFSSFLKVFGPGTTKAQIAASSPFWDRKALAPNTFATRLFRIQPVELDGKSGAGGIFSSIFARRPSWNNLSPASRSRSGTPGPYEEEVKVEAKELSPFTQADFEADNVYVLDAYTTIYVLVGPVFATSLSEHVRSTLFAQAVRFAAEYGILAAAAEAGRPGVLSGVLVLSGVPDEVKLLVRHWDEGLGLWGTGGLMAGSMSTVSRTGQGRQLELQRVLDVLCRE